MGRAQSLLGRVTYFTKLQFEYEQTRFEQGDRDRQSSYGKGIRGAAADRFLTRALAKIADRQ